MATSVRDPQPAPATQPQGAAPNPRPRGIRARARAIRSDYAVLRASRYGLTPIATLTLIDFVQKFDNGILGLLLPEVRRDLGVSLAVIGTATTLIGVILKLAAPVIGYLSDRIKRTVMVGVSTIMSGVFSLLTAGTGSLGQLVAIRTVDELGEGFGDVPTTSLIADYYPVDARAKAFSFRVVALQLAAIAAPLTVGSLAVAYGWRMPFLLVGSLVLASGALVILRLREPVRGYWERRASGADEQAADEPEPPVSWAEGMRTLLAVRTLRRTLVALPVLVFAALGFTQLFNFFLLEELHLDPLQRGLIFAPAAAAGLIGILAGGRVADRLIRYRPGRVLGYVGALAIVTGGLYTVIAMTPANVAVIAIIYVVLQFAGGLVMPANFTVTTLVMPPRMRGQGAGLLSFATIPAFLLAPIAFYLADQYGVRFGMAAFAPVYAIAGLLIISAARFFELDMRSAIASATGTQEYRTALRDGQTRLLLCKDVDVHYGSVQVLFGVDLTVDQGEIVALLGTNGAGKSTLLRAIAGIQEASAGAILLNGRDITHVPPHEIARMGVVMMPGGRGVFPSLTVAENLDVALSHAEDQTDARAKLERVYGFFPVLRERLGQEAGLLSGGEQQMVALAQAFLARPTILMIDELSLGLAPSVVQDLLQIVRAIHAEGTTVILVEQSVNVALTVAQRAVFMEKGEVRFDGPTADLLRRPDVMRAVYLKGSGALTDAPVRAATRDPGIGTRVILSTEGLTKRFGGRTVLDGVTLDLREGEVLGLIGPNGAGKTTLFDLISGFVHPDGGTVTLDGVDVTRLGPDARARLRLVRRFQDAKIFPSLTVAEAIAVALERKLNVRNTFLTALQLPNVRQGEMRVRARADRLIELLELGSYRDKFVGELSTGLRRVVDLACVLAAEPKVLLLDEPSAGIAQAEAESLGPLLRRVRYETDCSMLVIEHDMPLISAISDELVALVQGTVIVRGTPDEVLAHPTLVEAYLGTDEATMKRSGVLR